MLQTLFWHVFLLGLRSWCREESPLQINTDRRLYEMSHHAMHELHSSGLYLKLVMNWTPKLQIYLKGFKHINMLFSCKARDQTRKKTKFTKKCDPVCLCALQKKALSLHSRKVLECQSVTVYSEITLDASDCREVKTCTTALHWCGPAHKQISVIRTLTCWSWRGAANVFIDFHWVLQDAFLTTCWVTQMQLFPAVNWYIDLFWGYNVWLNKQIILHSQKIDDAVVAQTMYKLSDIHSSSN